MGKEVCKDIIFDIGIIVLSLAMFSPIIVVPLTQYYKEYDNYYCDIETLERGSGVKGDFILGSGSVKDCIVYYFYVESEQGYKIDKIDNSGHEIYIVEDDNIKPCIREVKKKKTMKRQYIIYVPKGTIIKEYRG